MSFQRVRGFLTKEVSDFSKIPKSTPQIIVGIGPEASRKLRKNRINTVKKLSQQDSKSLYQLTGIRRSQLERWISAARILVAVSEMRTRDEKKIVVAGLDGSGIASIVRTITGRESIRGARYGFSAERSQTMSVRVRTSLFGWINSEIIGVTRLDGEEQPGAEREVFSRADLLVFVIDAHDHVRHRDALNYLGGILEFYSKSGETPYTVIFLHGGDRASESLEHEERMKLLRDEVRKLFKEYQNARFQIEYTNIFEQEKLFLSFSSALKKIAGASHVVEGILRDYAEFLGSRDLMVFDDKALLIADYTSNHGEVLSIAAMRMIWLREDLSRNYSKDIGTMTVELAPGEIIVCKPVDWEDKTIYIAGVLPDPEKSGVLNLLGEELKPWIRNIGVV
ncbi:MAG: helix-hairpin-helix domain-containing protein [Candidatus Freyarchaeota archaeon]